MKQILIIDESPLFREYLRLKLEGSNLEVSIAVNAVDGISKMRSIIPDLIIMDYHLNRQGSKEILKQKKTDPNTTHIPIIILAQRIDQTQLLELVPYNVKKVFAKPVKVDALFVTLSELLDIPFSIDESPGIVEVHVNDNIIFIQIAQGLNRDKLDILRFKIIELLNLYEIRLPRVIVMLSDIKLSFADAPNMEKLLETVIQASKAKHRYIRILTKDTFVRQFIKGQKEYDGIEVVSNLHYAVDDLLAGTDSRADQSEKKAELIGDKILRATTRENTEAMVLKFDAEAKSAKFELVKNSLKNLKIAVVDNDIAIHDLIKTTFKKTGAAVFAFSTGEEYLAAAGNAGEEFALVFLDIDVPATGGFAALQTLNAQNIKYPIIALSAIMQKEAMIKAIQMGVKSYLVKPLKPEDIFKKSIETLKANF
ncbi:MAG: response regulator [Treponema sp.]|nr:response regulator [Treponema sp.]